MTINRSKKALIDLCKYTLLLACLFKVIVSGLGVCLFSFHNSSVCTDVMQVEAGDADCKEDLSKEDSNVAYCSDYTHLKLPKKWMQSVLSNYSFDNEAIIQFFYPHVPTPPPNC